MVVGRGVPATPALMYRGVISRTITSDMGMVVWWVWLVCGGCGGCVVGVCVVRAEEEWRETGGGDEVERKKKGGKREKEERREEWREEGRGEGNRKEEKRD